MQKRITGIILAALVTATVGHGLFDLTRVARAQEAGGAGGDAKPAPVTLPFVLYADDQATTPYTWSGWMGDVASIAIDPKFAENPRSGKTSMKCEFKAITGYGGVVWQNPPEDWGDKPGGHNLTGAKKLTFWARGHEGGESVSFKMGVIGKTAKFPDSGSAGLDDVKLEKEWKQFSIDLAGQDLSTIKTGFMWVLGSPGKPVTFFIDDVQYE